MASGDRVFLGEPGSDIVLEIDGPSLPESADPIEGSGVLNEGSVEAAGGTIVLAAAGDIYSQAISNVGSLSVSAQTGDGGQVELTSAGGQITNSGTIDASGDNGGSVTIDGGDVALSADSVIHADAMDEGDGGEVLIYADNLDIDGVTTAAGIDGYILFDPVDDVLDIDQAAADAIEVSLLATATVDVAANVTINLNGEIDSSVQVNDHTLNFKDENANNDLTINLNNKIILGSNQTLTGDGTEINVASTGLIQNGIDVAATGAAVTVSNGTYTEDLTIVKSVTLEGAQAGVAVSGRTAGDASESTITGEHTITGSTVVIDGFTLSDPDLGSGNVLISLDSSGGAIDDVTLKNNFVGLGSGDIGVDLGGYSTTNGAITNVTIEDSVFTGPGDQVSNPMRIGGWFGSDFDVAVDGVTFQRNTVDKGSIPIQLQDEDLANITITQNTFTSTDGTVYIWGNSGSTPLGVLSDFEYSKNIVDNTNSYGIGIDVFDVFGNSNFGGTIRVIENSFDLDDVPTKYGFDSVSILSSGFAGTIDASGNWYGTNDASGVAAEVSSNVDYTPWLDNGTDQSVDPGFQGDFSTLHISTAGPQVGTDGRIQEAINLLTAGPGSVIKAVAGTYNDGAVNVNKELAGIYFQGTSEISDTVTLNADLNIYTENDGSLTLNAIEDNGTNSLLVDTESLNTTNGQINLDGSVEADDGITITGGIVNVGDSASDKLNSDGAVSITGTGAVTIDAAIDPDTVSITSAADASVNINNSVTADTQITVTADDDVTFSASGDLDTTSGSITVTADADGDDNGAGGAITMVDGTVIDAGSGTITLAADENIAIGRLVTTNNTASAVSVTSTSGAVTDAGNTGGADIDATGGASAAVTISAVTGIGSAVNPIETDIEILVTFISQRRME
jgi:hypothetical protein